MENLLSSVVIPQIKIEYLPLIDPSELPQITNAAEAYKAVIQSWDKTNIYLNMEVKLMVLNKAGRLLGIYSVSSGGTDRTFIDPRLIYLTAIGSLAASIILVRNSPGGNLEPSAEDRKSFDELKRAGDLLSINCHDFLIITGKKYFSLQGGDLI
jgi:DNA repair protein RadC